MRLALGLLIALAAAGPAGAEDFPADTATPDGAATLYPHWTGASPAICHGDRAVVAFTLRVGPGSRAGRVRPRIVRTEQGGLTGVRAGAWVELPATPGDHRFTTAVHQGRCETREEVALEQETGGHVIVHRHPPGNGDRLTDMSMLNELWVFQPPVADGATAAPSETRPAHDLLMSWEYEADGDHDGLGDETRDPTPPGKPPVLEPPPSAPPGPVPPETADFAASGPDRQRPLRRGGVLAELWSRRGGRATVTVRIAPGVFLRRSVTLPAGREVRLRVRLTAAARRALRRRARTATLTAAVRGEPAISWRTRLLR